MLDTMHELGYANSAATLERESGVHYMATAACITALRSLVLEGTWSEVLRILPHSPVRPEDLFPIVFAVLRQQLLELFEADQPLQAVALLREELAPLLGFMLRSSAATAPASSQSFSTKRQPCFAATPAFPGIPPPSSSVGAPPLASRRKALQQLAQSSAGEFAALKRLICTYDNIFVNASMHVS